MLKLVNLSEQHITLNVFQQEVITLASKGASYEFKDALSYAAYQKAVSPFILAGMLELQEVKAPVVEAVKEVVEEKPSKSRKAKDASLGDVQ